MADLRKIFILHTTSGETNAGSDSKFQLVVVTSGRDVTIDFPRQDHNNRQRNRTDEYVFDVNREGVTTESEIFIKMREKEDGWLPATMWAIGETVSGDFEILGAHPEWGNRWFDRGNNPAGPDAHKISN